MKKTIRAIFAVLAVIFVIGTTFMPVYAAEQLTAAQAEEQAEAQAPEVAASEKNTKAVAAAIAIAVASAAGAIAMAIAVKSASEAIARQPEAAGNIRTSTMLGLVFIETAIIYALIVVILIIFVL